MRTPPGPPSPKRLVFDQLDFVARVAAPTIQIGAPNDSQRSTAATRGATTVKLQRWRVTRAVHPLRQHDRYGAVDHPFGLRIQVELGLSPRD